MISTISIVPFPILYEFTVPSNLFSFGFVTSATTTEFPVVYPSCVPTVIIKVLPLSLITFNNVFLAFCSSVKLSFSYLLSIIEFSVSLLFVV